jgi:hypothetical protein
MHQPLTPHGIVEELVRKDLERHLAPEVHVDGAIDNTHPAATDLVEDLIVG